VRGKRHLIRAYLSSRALAARIDIALLRRMRTHGHQPAAELAA
jgi:hypothetical protein